MATDTDPRPACPGWAKVPARDRAAHAPERCGARRAVIVARRGNRTQPAWRLRCGVCGRWWWSRNPGSAAYPGASVASALGWEVAAAAALAGFQGRRPCYGERPDARPYFDPAEPRTRGGSA